MASTFERISAESMRQSINQDGAGTLPRAALRGIFLSHDTETFPVAAGEIGRSVRHCFKFDTEDQCQGILGRRYLVGHAKRLEQSRFNFPQRDRAKNYP